MKSIKCCQTGCENQSIVYFYFDRLAVADHYVCKQHIENMRQQLERVFVNIPSMIYLDPKLNNLT